MCVRWTQFILDGVPAHVRQKVLAGHDWTEALLRGSNHLMIHQQDGPLFFALTVFSWSCYWILTPVRVCSVRLS